jgi:endopolyphosphatase
MTLILQAPKKLHGRFLHITDMHPDPHYSARASTSKSCHGKKAKKKGKRAGYWGTPDVYVAVQVSRLLIDCYLFYK